MLFVTEIFDVENITSYAKLTYCCLGRFADSRGVCWPSYSTLAKKTGLSQRKIIESMKELEVNGYVLKTKRQETQKGNVSNVYTLMHKGNKGKSLKIKPEKENNEHLVTGVHNPYAQDDTPLMHDMHSKLSILTYPIEDITKKEKQTLFSSVLDQYHQICISFPKVLKKTSGREKAVRKIIIDEQHSVEVVEQVFLRAQASDFLTGRSPREGKYANWKCDFDWLMKPYNFIKVIEGKYDNQNSAEGGPANWL